MTKKTAVLALCLSFASIVPVDDGPGCGGLSPACAQATPKSSYLHYLKAVLESNQGDYDAALHEYEAALELDPQSAFMYQQAAELALEMGKTDRAMELAQRFVELSPESHLAYELLANVYWSKGDWRKAQEAFEKTLELKPDYSEALFALGNLLSSQSPEKAKEYLLDYLSKNPDNASEAAYQLALMEQREGHFDKAAEYLNRAVGYDPDNLQARMQLGQIYEVRRDTDAAIAEYMEILSRDPRNVALLNHVGEMHYMRDELEKAREYFLRAKDVLPSHPAACLWLALMAEQDKDYESAVKYVRDSAALKVDASLNLRLSYYLTQDDKLEDAVKVLEDAHAKWPENNEISYFLALGYDDLKQPAKAVGLLQKILDEQPDHRDARFQLGAMYEKLGKMDQAELQFREIIRTHPHDASALNYLGYSLADRDMKLDDAEGFVRRAVRLDPENAAYIDSLGWVLFKRGRYEEALLALRKAVERLPDDETIWEHVGETYAVLGDTATAWNAWKTAQVYAEGKSKLAEKLSGIEDHLSAEELGERYQDFLLRRRGELAAFGGPCVVEGKMGGQEFKFQGILHYKAPWRLSVDVLGPLFTTMFRISINDEAGGFAMDTLKIEGVDPELIRDRLYKAMRLLRDYFEGGMFRDGPSRYKKGWTGSRVLTPEAELKLNKTLTKLVEVESSDAKGMKLELSGYMPMQGHSMPSVLGLEGKGFRIRFKLPNPSVRFESVAPAGLSDADRPEPSE